LEHNLRLQESEIKKMLYWEFLKRIHQCIDFEKKQSEKMEEATKSSSSSRRSRK